MSRQNRILLVAAYGAMLLLPTMGCLNDDTFECTTDKQCAGPGSRCLIHHCAVRDDTCASGYRYSKSSGTSDCVATAADASVDLRRDTPSDTTPRPDVALDSSSDVATDLSGKHDLPQDSGSDWGPDVRPDVRPDGKTKDLAGPDTMSDIQRPDTTQQGSWHLYDGFNAGTSPDPNRWNVSIDEAQWTGPVFSTTGGALQITATPAAQTTSAQAAMHLLRLPLGSTALRFDWKKIKATGISFYVSFTFSDSICFKKTTDFTFGCWSGQCGPHFDGVVPDTGKLSFRIDGTDLIMENSAKPGVSLRKPAVRKSLRFLRISVRQGDFAATIDNVEYFGSSTILSDPGIPAVQPPVSTWTTYDDFTAGGLAPAKWVLYYDPAEWVSTPFVAKTGVMAIEGHVAPGKSSGAGSIATKSPNSLSELRFDWTKGANYGAISNTLTLGFCDFSDCFATTSFTFGCWSGGCPHFDGNVPASGKLSLTYDGSTLRFYRNGVELASRPSKMKPRYFYVHIRAGDPALADNVEGTIDNVEYRSITTPTKKCGDVAFGPFVVSAKIPWVDTGIAINAGQTISFKASGLIAIANGNSPNITPNGWSSTLAGTLAPPLNRYGLIGRIGTAGAPFFIGDVSTIKASTGGTLFLSANDEVGGFGDNSGQFVVEAGKCS